MNPKVVTLKRTREIAQSSFEKVLSEVLASKEKVSEKGFATKWLVEFRKSKSTFPSGWYLPPPNGMGVLFGSDDEFERISFETLRKEKSWPKADVFLNRQSGIITVYFSPVDRQSGIIGDYGTTVYLGTNTKLLAQIDKTKSQINEIFEITEAGMKISDLCKKTEELLVTSGMVNDWWISTTDKFGTNFGHTIPGINHPFTDSEMQTLKSDNWQDVCDFISKKRVFFNGIEQTVIEAPFALTIESRLKDKERPELPPIYLHTIAVVNEDGTKEHLKPY